MKKTGFRIILKDPNVKVILVNIFGGIVRCDRVARGIVQAAQNVEIKVPLIVRLQGTNAEEGLKILQESGLKIETAQLLKEAVSNDAPAFCFQTGDILYVRISLLSMFQVVLSPFC